MTSKSTPTSTPAPAPAPATWLGFPEPEDTASIPRVTAQELAARLRKQPEDGAQASSPVQLIDVRRADLTVSETR